MKLPVPIRLLKDRYLGETSRSEVFAQNRLTELSPYLGSQATGIATAAVAALSAYQDPDYALLYLERLARYAGPKQPVCPFLSDLAIQMDRRMRFEDAVALAMQSADTRTKTSAETVCLVDIVGMLPPGAAGKVMPILTYLGWSHRTVRLRFDRSNPLGRMWADACVLLKRVRSYSRRGRIEQAWVERWLHMVDRTLLKQPSAAIEVIRSAELIDGIGLSYHRGLTRWHAIVDNLIKPACDGAICVDDMAGAVQKAVQAAISTSDSRQFDCLLVEIVRASAGPPDHPVR